MKLNYYVLGIKNNKMVNYYLEEYYIKLLDMIKDLKDIGILENEYDIFISNDAKKFVLNPDQSSIINLLHLEFISKKPQGFLDINFYINNLKNEIKIFSSEGINSTNLVMNKGKKIYGTNIKLTLEDNNPFNIKECHPEHHLYGGVLGFGEADEEEWLKIYEKTFSLLKNIDEGIYSELNQIINKIVPLGTSKGVHNSSSYKECVGHLYMGFTIDSNNPEINNLEAIIHESSHNKLNLIMQFDPIVLNDKEEKYYSSIRPDARHMHGVFLGYHAFAPTMYIIMKAYKDGFLGNDKGWYEKIILYYIKTKLLQKTVKKYAILTDLGKEISEEIDYVISLMDSIIKDLNPSLEILDKVRKKQEMHFGDVNKNYKKLEY